MEETKSAGRSTKLPTMDTILENKLDTQQGKTMV
jgi:hypothetical protein